MATQAHQDELLEFTKSSPGHMELLGFLKGRFSGREATRMEVRSLLSRKSYKGALSTIRSKVTAASGAAFTLEKAYALYQSPGMVGDALKALDGARVEEVSGCLGDGSECFNQQAISDYLIGMAELRAQCLYRLENYGEASRYYQGMATGDEEEVAANLAACLASQECVEEAAFAELPDSFDVLYNHACYLVRVGRLTEATSKLEEAEDVGVEALTDLGFSPDEIADEVAVVKGQKAYVRHVSGEVAAALKAYRGLLSGDGPLDPSLKAVLNNNSAVALSAGDSRSVAVSRHMDAAAEPKVLGTRLRAAQRRTILMNVAAVHVMEGAAEKANASVKSLMEGEPNFVGGFVLKAALLIRGKKVPDAVSLLQDFLKRVPGSATARLALAQVLMDSGDKSGAADVLCESVAVPCVGGLQDSRVPSLPLAAHLGVATLAAVLSPGTADQVLEKAGGVLQTHGYTVDAAEAFVRAAEVLSGRGENSGVLKAATAALGLLNSLLELTPRVSTLTAIAKALVMGCSGPGDDMGGELFDRAEAEEVLSAVVDWSGESEEIGLALAEASTKTIQGSAEAEAPGSVPSGSAKGRGGKKKKPRKSRGVPVTVEAGCSPDPERWLPKHQRSSFRSAGGGKKNRGSMGSGIREEDIEKFDVGAQSKRK